MNEEKITALEKKIQKEHGNIAGMVVLKDGRTVYENYFNGCGADDTIHVFSVTKSIVSILAGIAIDRGYIGSVAQKVLDFFPDYTVKRGEKTIQTITLKNLLTMTAPYKFRSAPYTRFFSSEDWVMAALDLLGGRKPAGEFRYMEMIGPDILSGILSNATGQPVLDFAREALFEPLHIAVASNIVLYTPQEHVAFIKKNCASGWGADEKGHNTVGAYAHRCGHGKDRTAVSGRREMGRQTDCFRGMGGGEHSGTQPLGEGKIVLRISVVDWYIEWLCRHGKQREYHLC